MPTLCSPAPFLFAFARQLVFAGRRGPAGGAVRAAVALLVGAALLQPVFAAFSEAAPDKPILERPWPAEDLSAARAASDERLLLDDAADSWNLIGISGLVPQDVAAGDFNGDGIEDLAVAYAYDDRVRWYFGSVSGEFRLGGEVEVGVYEGRFNDLPRTLAVRDLDGDGLLDLVVVCSGNPYGFLATAPSVGILYGTAFGGFEPFAPLSLAPASNDAALLFSLALAVECLDDDDLPDLVVGHYDSRQITVVLQKEKRTWGDPVLYDVATAGHGPVALAAEDLDFDGSRDLLVLNRRDLQVWRGDGGGGFQAAARVAIGDAFTAMVAEDFDRDGAWDLAVTDGGDGILHVLCGLTADGKFERRVSRKLAADAPLGVMRGGAVDLAPLDADLDGLADLAVIYLSSGGGEVFRGITAQDKETFPFESYAAFETALSPRALAVGDFNGNGWSDLAIAHEGDITDDANADVVIFWNDAPGFPSDQRPDSLAPQAIELPASRRSARGLAWDEARGGLWTIDTARHRLVLLDPETARTLSALRLETSSAADAVASPWDLALRDQNRLWASAPESAAVVQVSLDRTVAVVERSFPIAAASGVSRPGALAWNADAGRLYVADRTAPTIAVFREDGVLLERHELAGGGLITGLAWQNGQLWATLAPAADSLETGLSGNSLVLLDLAGDGPIAAAPLVTGDDDTDEVVLPSLQAITASTAVSSSAARTSAYLWGLEEGGSLVRRTLTQIVEPGTPSSPPSFATTEASTRSLTRFGIPRAVARDAAGSLVMGFAGEEPVLLRLDAAGTVLDTIPLGAEDSSQSPVSIDGLAYLQGVLHVLDAQRRCVLRLGPDGLWREPLPLAGAGIPARLRGLHVDAETGALLVGGAGRILEFSGVGELERVHRLPASVKPATLSAGRTGEEVAVFDLRAEAFVFLRKASTGALEEASTVPFSRYCPPSAVSGRVFQPLIADWTPGEAPIVTIAGAGDVQVVTLSLETAAPTTAASGLWALYR